MSDPRPRRRSRAVVLAALTAFVLVAGGQLANPMPASAGTAENIEAAILSLVNAARANRGIPPLRLRASLVDFAGDRAAKMASTGVLKHPRCLPCKLDRRGISYSTYGETIAWSYPWGIEAARKLFRIWKNSPPHWGILMNAKYDRIGIGVAERNEATWAAAVLTG
jgi:uncharacterized protein YkwD